MKNVYLEVGAYSLKKVKQFYTEHKNEEWYFELFEPNPIRIDRINYETTLYNIPNVNLHCVAVASENCKRNFYLGKGKFGQAAASLFCEKGRLSGEFICVDCIDFNEWIINNLNKYDNIYMNMDIEGAEYEVLPCMIKGESIYYMKSVEIEFHYKDFQRHQEIYMKFENVHKELKQFFDSFNAEKVLLKL